MSYTSGIINIPSVTGNIVITAVAASVTVTSISASFNQGGNPVYTTDTLDSLRQYLTVTATYSNGSTATVSLYTLSGTLAVGTSTITVTYESKTTTFNVTVSDISLDTVVYEGKSYRDIFITANQLQGFDFENGLPSGMTSNAGSPSISEDDCYSVTHSMKAFGTSSTQYKSVNTTGVADWNKYANTMYFCAYKGRCDRYVSGYLGISLATGLFPAITAVTDGWVTKHNYVTNTSGSGTGQAFVGSYTSANLDGYIDDIVYIPLANVFSTMPSEANILQWYEAYCDLRKAGEV